MPLVNFPRFLSTHFSSLSGPSLCLVQMSILHSGEESVEERLEYKKVLSMHFKNTHSRKFELNSSNLELSTHKETKICVHALLKSLNDLFFLVKITLKVNDSY